MIRNVTRLSIFGGILCAIFAATANADFKDDLGFTKLQSELGGSTPDGSGITVARHGCCYADPGGFDQDFEYPTLEEPYGGTYSGHDTVVARFYVGDLSIAQGVPTVLEYSASQGGWEFTSAGNGHSILNLQGNNTDISGGPLPGYSAARVTEDTLPPTPTSAMLRRLDWHIATDDATHISFRGANTFGTSTTHAYNTITIGLAKQSNATPVYGWPNIWTNSEESIYLQGQHPWPTLVSGNSTDECDGCEASSWSNTTPVAGSAATLLVQTAHDDPDLSTDPDVQSFTNRAGLTIYNAERSEVIKAAMMAGALRDGRHTGDDGTQQYLIQETSGGTNATAYRQFSTDQTDNGLDKRVGAGQLNVRNSYYIIAAGEQNSIEDGGGENDVPASGESERGFDYDPHFGGLNDSNYQATYLLPTSSSPRLLTASLVWNITVVGDTEEDPGVFDGTTSLYDMSLSLVDLTLDELVVFSDSAIENTENLWVELQPNHAYQLLVERGGGSSAFDWDYGLAWQAALDTDADGVPDEQDNCKNVANGPFILDAGDRSQYDADSDGYGNMCDGDLNQSGTVTTADYTLITNHLNSTTYPIGDLNGSGTVTTADRTILQNMLNQHPGPSGLCATSPAMPCTLP